MAENIDIGTLAQESDAEESSEAFHVLYDSKEDKYFLIQDGKKEHLPVKRIKGHFDKDQHYVIESVSEPR